MRVPVQSTVDVGSWLAATAATLRELPGLNHMFQTAIQGLPAEYGELEETFAPAALQIITDWVVSR